MLGGARLSACFLMILVGVVALALPRTLRRRIPLCLWLGRSSEKAKLFRSEDVVQGHKIVRFLPLSREFRRSRYQALCRAGTQLHPRHSRPPPRTRQDQRSPLRNCSRLGPSALRRWVDTVLLLHPPRRQSKPADPLCARGSEWLTTACCWT